MLRVGTAQLLVSHLSPELVCGRGRGEHGAPVGVPGLVKQPQLVAEPVQSNIISSILYNYLFFMLNLARFENYLCKKLISIND